jgi:prefoldin subunit 5
MKALITFTAILGVASAAHAQYVVTDPVSDVLNQVMHLQDIAKTVEMINNQVQQINTLTQELQQTEAYVKAFGNPEQLVHIVGADELIRSLKTPGVGQPLIQLQNGASGSEAFRDDQNGLYLRVGANITTPNGTELPRNEELYRKFAASDAAIQNFKTVFKDVSQRREVLKRQIADTTQQLQAATTAAETQKLTGVLTGYNAGLAAADKEVDQALGESVVLTMQNDSDREKQDLARAEERKAEFGEAMSKYSETFQINDAPAAFPTH